MVLTWLDYAIIAGYLIAITAFGSWFARFQKSTRDYFLTGRSVPWWAICFTIVATETSTLSFIGVPAGAFAGNMTFLQLAMGYIVGRLVVSVLFIPAYFRGELYTSYELLQRRFGPGVKNIAAAIFLVTRTLADGVRLFATALVITVVTQVPVTWTVIIVGVAMIIYTTRGGAAAVIWTDVVQMFVYIAGALAVLYGLLQNIDGGWSAAVAMGSDAGKFRVFDFSTGSAADLYLLGRHVRRRRTDPGDPWHRSIPGTAVVERDILTGRRDRARLERRDRFCAVHAVSDHRRAALRVLSADATATTARDQR